MYKMLFFNRLKIHVRTKESIFWLLLFPILLATLFHFAFANMLSGESMGTVKVAVVDDGSAKLTSMIYKMVLNQDSFEVDYVSQEEAAKNLEDEKIDGYILLGMDPSLVVKESGMPQTILKEMMDYIRQETAAITTIYSQNGGEVTKDFTQAINGVQSYIQEKKVSDNEPDLVAVYFYTVLAMAAMYGAINGMYEVNLIQANQSKTAMRINLGALSKMKVFLTNLSATCLIQILMMFIIVLYMRVVLGVNFGDRYGLILFTSAFGAVTGVSVGTMLGAVVKKDENFKTGIIIAVTMACCFLSGMMGDEVRSSIRKSLPLLDKLNPVALITDSYYRLFYFDELGGYFQNIAILGAMAVICFTITILVLRRQKYDSI